MKKLVYFLLSIFITSSTFIACDSDDDVKKSPFTKVVLGGQNNTEIGGFYSFNNEKVYTLNEASTYQSTIDLISYYNEGENEMIIASAGADNSGIFSFAVTPENWTIKDTTFFYQIESGAFTVNQFDALNENSVIDTLFNSENAVKKATLLQANDIYAFQTEDDYYGVFKVLSVTVSNTGSIEIEYLIQK